MSTPCATSSSSNAVKYPLVKFAAVHHVQYTITDDHHPEAVWKKGGVMFTEVVPGEYVIIVVGSSYNVTVNRCIMTADMEICPDIRCTEIRWSVTPRYRSQMKSWTYLRFAVMTDLTKFAREVFAAFDAITAKRQLIDNRVYDIAYDSPSNFTKYCREYLGDDYFDDLREDSDDEMYESDGGR